MNKIFKDFQFWVLILNLFFSILNIILSIIYVDSSNIAWNCATLYIILAIWYYIENFNLKNKIKERTKMTKTELEKQLAEMQEQFDKMQDELNKLKQVKIEEPKKRWKPELNYVYYSIGSGGDIYRSYWENDEVDKWRYLTSNVFKTKEEAEEHKKKIEIQSKFKNFVKERTEELDWGNDNQEKWFMYYSYLFENIDFDTHYITKYQGVIYASSRKILEDAIAEIGEDNIKKYVLGVKNEN